MSKVAYLDCPTGIAGDMCLGALLDAGVPLAYLTEQLQQLGIAQEYQLQAESVQRHGQQATKAKVILTHPDHSPSEHHHPNSEHHHSHSNSQHPNSESLHPNSESLHPNSESLHPNSESLHPHSEHHHSHSEHHHSHSDPHLPLRCLPEIEQLIQQAKLPTQVKTWSLAIFRQLAQAEGAVHGISPQAVHFHEVGATDAIVDIVGTCLGLDWLGIEQLYCSALPTGGGTIHAAHGRLPVPAPAVLKLLQMGQVPIYHNGLDRELVTPTGAAIVTTLASGFGHPPAMTLKTIGLGAGTIELPMPNLIRLWVGETWGAKSSNSTTTTTSHPAHHKASHEASASITATSVATSDGTEAIAVLETQIDDLNPQAIGYLFEVLFAAGALDVFTQAIGMKKSRPGILLTVLCPSDRIAACEAVLFRETSTLGIRHSLQTRSCLARHWQSVQTPYGAIAIKIATYQGTIVNVQPEYEDCARLARAHQLPWRSVHQMALQAWYGQQTPPTFHAHDP